MIFGFNVSPVRSQVADKSVLFGKKKNNGEPPAPLNAAEAKLRERGVTQQSLRQQWGDITLWTIKDKKGKVKLKVDTSREKRFEWNKFAHWLRNQLPGFKEVEIQDKPVSECCHKGCSGCLAGGDKAKRNEWEI